MASPTRAMVLKGRVIALIPTSSLDLEVEISDSNFASFLECEIYKVQEKSLHMEPMTQYKVFIGNKDDQYMYHLLDWRDDNTINRPDVGTWYTYRILLHKLGTKNDCYLALLGCRPGVKLTSG